MNILLCGLPGAGKTTVGKRLALLLQWQHIDTDRYIEKIYFQRTSTQFSRSQIYLIEGEKYFRTLEREVIEKLSSQNRQNRVISLGGGTLLDEKNRALLRSIGQIIYLKTSFQTAWKRLQTRGIPPYLDKKDPETAFYKLAHAREALYIECANTTIDH